MLNQTQLNSKSRDVADPLTPEPLRSILSRLLAPKRRTSRLGDIPGHANAEPFDRRRRSSATIRRSQPQPAPRAVAGARASKAAGAWPAVGRRTTGGAQRLRQISSPPGAPSPDAEVALI